MDFDRHVARYNNQFIAIFGGECVANVAVYCQENGKPIAYANAKDWWNHPALTSAFDFIVNNPNDLKQIPPRGAIMIWSGNLAGSGGYGHIGIFDAVVSPGIFRSFDANWGGRQCHFVTHNWNNVIGWMVPKGATNPPPQGGDRAMNPQEETEAYQIVLQRNPDGPATGRTGIAFIRDARGELTQQREGIRQQQESLQNSINSLNAKVTELTSNDALDKEAIQKGLADIAHLTAELETAHDTIKELEANPVIEPVDEKEVVTNWFKKIWNSLFKKG